jgi:predicted PurR-regulated permease PerM
MESDQRRFDWGPERADGPVSRRFGNFALLAATTAGAYFCYRLAVPFLPALTFALVLAVLFAPLHRAMEARLQCPSLAALASVLIVAATLVVPGTFVGRRLVAEVTNGAGVVQSELADGAWRRALETHPQVAPIVDWLDRVVDLSAIFHSAAAGIGTVGAAFVRGSVMQVLGVLLTFYLLFYFLRDRTTVLKTLRGLLPLSQVEIDRVFLRIADTVHATIYGTLVVAGLQGALGGAMFWWLGIPAPLLWGFVMALLSLVPVLGSYIVWIPVAAYLLLMGDWTRAAILTAWGALVIGHVDNILRPILVGDRLKLHPVVLFISFLGGLSLLGPVGLLLGPMGVTVTLTLLDIWRGRRQGAGT